MFKGERNGVNVVLNKVLRSRYKLARGHARNNRGKIILRTRFCLKSVRYSSQLSAMPSRKNKKEVPKRCRCQPSCGKVLGSRSRRRHYRKIQDKSCILPSKTVSDRDSILGASVEEENNFSSAPDDLDMAGPVASDASSECAMSISSPHIAGSPSALHEEGYIDELADIMLNFEDEDDMQSSSTDGAESLLDFEDVRYDEMEEMVEFLTYEEQQQQLQDALGAELEHQLYEARE